ncbi:MAG TPA: neutral/alkaline non-lysosomal ceramidase N-terminal domain-containing protein [Verrucomicrobiota bacterium]|nr:neutral/alkaline non-lysosomal ceramidase N-terminal domain-containing protein [Verrucomicrobiota bacterium]
MKKLMSLAAKTALGAFLLILLLSIVSLAPVDHSAWEATVLARELESALNAIRTQTNVVVGQLRAGFGRAKLTPNLGATVNDPEQGFFQALPLAGYGARKGRPATGFHDDLWAKAVALAVNGRTGIMVSADALIIPREVAEMTVDRLKARGIQRSNLYFGATHAHSSIGGWGRGVVAEAFAGGFVPESRAWFARQLALAAEAALDDLSPAHAGVAFFASTNHVKNRLVGERGSIDAGFRILKIIQEDGDHAVLGSYSAHATVLPASVMQFSGDYPGAWAATMEKNGCALALFFAGGVGSHSPRAGAPAWEGVERMGAELARFTKAALKQIEPTNHVAFGLVTLPLRLPALQVRISDGVRLRPWLASLLLPVEKQTIVQALRLGDATWLSTPCDFSGELAMSLAIPDDRKRVTAVTSFNGDYIGYVIPSKYYHMAGYEPRTMSFFGPQMPQYMVAALQGVYQAVW